jgi:predicted AlkP superfamily phosphohydrolase/phosphomutase
MAAAIQAKTILIGVDGFSPATMQQFIDQGELPAIAAIAQGGVQVPLVSTLPATTPVAWASIVTGAPPSVTGIEGFLIHVPGHRVDYRVSGCYAYRNRAQPVWEAAHEAGLHAYVVKFPLSYPSSAAALRIDGAAGWGGLKCFHEIASTSVAATCAERSETRIEPFTGTWRNEPADSGQPVWCGVWRLHNLWELEDVVLHLAVTSDATVTIATAPDHDAVLARLAPRAWSKPLTVLAPSRRGMVECSFRVRILECSPDPLRLRIFNTPLHERTGHSVPDDEWRSILDAAGPIEEQSDPSLMFESHLDLDTQLDIFALNVDWLRRVAVEVISRRPWDLLMLHTHVLDWAHHLLQGAIDPRHPRYEPRRADEHEAALLRVYRLVDSLVSDISAAAGADTNVLLAGDHGQDLQHTEVHLNEWLAAEGLLKWSGAEIDWSQTSAYAAGNYIHVSVAGRDESGIVSPEHFTRVRDDIVDRLYAMADPRTEVYPVRIAGPKEMFEPLGANGAGVGDVVVCFRAGYHATNTPGGPFTDCEPLHAFTSNHDHFWPHDPTIHTRLYACGPSFRAGYVHPRTASVLDVAPTLCAALGIAPPAQNQGHRIDELFADRAVAPEKAQEQVTWAF